MGEEVLATCRSEQTGGQGANLARAAVRLGLSTELASVVGDDEPGARIRETLEADGIGADALKVVAGQTALAIAVVRQDGERAFITHLATSANLSVEDLNRHEDAIHRSRAIALVGTSNLPGINLSSAASLLQQAHARGVMTLFDPGWGEEITSGRDVDAILRVTDVFLPNLDEAEALTGRRDVGAALRLLRERCPGTVIVTCGEEGSATLDGETLVMVEPLPVEVRQRGRSRRRLRRRRDQRVLDDGDPVAAMIRGTAAAANYISRSEERYEAIGDWRNLASQVKIRRL